MPLADRLSYSDDHTLCSRLLHTMIAGIMNTSLDVFITVTILTNIGLITGIFDIVMTLIVVLAIMSYPC